ncbi:MAG: alpha amylase C-terminal domain-containing protein, partial [Verrucomicrobiota bacterium]
DFRWLNTDDGNNTVAFLRSKDSDQMLTVLCRNDQPRTIRIPAPAGWTRSSEAVFTSEGSSAKLRVEGGELVIDMPPLTAAVFKP